MDEGAQLTDLQMAVMRVLWERGEATSNEVRDALLAERPLAPTTVATMLSRLERRELVTHETRGRQFVYHATVSEDSVRGAMVQGIADLLFGGDVTALVSHLVTERDLRAGDLARVRELIDYQMKQRGKRNGR